MTNTEAIETLRANYPDVCFSLLREAVDAAIDALQAQDATGDIISRQAAIDALEREKTYSTAYKDGYTQTDYFKQYNMGLTDGIKALNKLPSVDAVPVVRCRDCKVKDEERCPWWHGVPADEFFCAWGERRADA